jgi:cysteine-rich repeat protein
MKKLSIFGLAMVLALVISPVFAAQFQLDFHGGDTSYPAGKTFETTITLSKGEKVLVDVWLTGLTTPPRIASIDMEFQWDTGSIRVNSVNSSFLKPDTLTPPAIWDAADSAVIPFGCTPPNCQYKLSVLKFSGGKPGPDIQMQTLELEGIAAGSAYAKATMGSNAILDEYGDTITNPQDGNVPVEVLSSTPVCGNGVKEGDEQCDDGNTTPGDGCDANCISEVCGNGILQSGEQCDDGNTTPGDGCDANCISEVCGNGILQSGEQCDDGNTTPGDGCSATCEVETAPFCGDGELDPGEQCDDGNTTPGDGCDANCISEVCGNGILQSGEQCDDGNTTPGDGCDANCILEVCGNGILQSGEECDDGNTTPGDGCSATCEVETAPFCGDGKLNPGEQCDDGNTTPGDGCDANCEVETAPFCGDGELDPGEQCDGDDDAACPDLCQANCSCGTPPECDVTLDVGEANTKPGANVAVDVSLKNLDEVRGVQVDICESDGNLNLTKSGNPCPPPPKDCFVCNKICDPTARTGGFTCSANELENGCCRVILVNTDELAFINKGTGPVLTLKYDVSTECSGGCKPLVPENAKVSDKFGDPLEVCTSSGEVCLKACGDIYPEEKPAGANNCGEGVVDLLDVIEAIDFALGIGTHSNCQFTKANVPTGTPPNCSERNDVVDLLDIIVIIDVVLERENCCNFAPKP